MEAALATLIAFLLSAQCSGLGTFWAFVITILLWSLVPLDAFGLGFIAAILAITLVTSNYKQTGEKVS